MKSWLLILIFGAVDNLLKLLNPFINLDYNGQENGVSGSIWEIRALIGA